jgi:hypothetical protein
MNSTRKGNPPIKIGSGFGLGPSIIASKGTDYEFDEESMVAPPKKPEPVIPENLEQSHVAIYFSKNSDLDDEYKIVGFVRGMESSPGKLIVTIRALLSVALDGCSKCLGNPMSLELIEVFSKNSKTSEWLFRDWLLSKVAIKEISGRQAFVEFSFEQQPNGLFKKTERDESGQQQPT